MVVCTDMRMKHQRRNHNFRTKVPITEHYRRPYHYASGLKMYDVICVIGCLSLEILFRIHKHTADIYTHKNYFKAIPGRPARSFLLYEKKKKKTILPTGSTGRVYSSIFHRRKHHSTNGSNSRRRFFFT